MLVVVVVVVDGGAVVVVVVVVGGAVVVVVDFGAVVVVVVVGGGLRCWKLEKETLLGDAELAGPAVRAGATASTATRAAAKRTAE
ncbi:MAG TPA: hypothetical protein VHU17_03860 [Acidimicrobiales bacterium]|nr:hypothetical protein [Acidimicrobiales bacterium]